MDLDRTDRLPAPPAAVLAALTDRDYLVTYVAELGAELHAAEAGGDPAATRVVAAVATTGVPSVFRKLVGDQIVVVDERFYAADGGSATVHVEAVVGGRRVDVDGTVTLSADGAGTALHTRATIVAKVPLIGGQVEAAVHGVLSERVLACQASVLAGRLGG